MASTNSNSYHHLVFKKQLSRLNKLLVLRDEEAFLTSYISKVEYDACIYAGKTNLEQLTHLFMKILPTKNNRFYPALVNRLEVIQQSCDYIIRELKPNHNNKGNNHLLNQTSSNLSLCVSNIDKKSNDDDLLNIHQEIKKISTILQEKLSCSELHQEVINSLENQRQLHLEHLNTFESITSSISSALHHGNLDVLQQTISELKKDNADLKAKNVELQDSLITLTTKSSSDFNSLKKSTPKLSRKNLKRKLSSTDPWGRTALVCDASTGSWPKITWPNQHPWNNWWKQMGNHNEQDYLTSVPLYFSHTMNCSKVYLLLDLVVENIKYPYSSHLVAKIHLKSKKSNITKYTRSQMNLKIVLELDGNRYDLYRFVEMDTYRSASFTFIEFKQSFISLPVIHLSATNIKVKTYNV